MRNGLVNPRLAGAALVALTCAFAAQAAPNSFTQRDAYDAAVATLGNVSKTTLDFDSLAAGDLIVSGATVGGIAFTYSLGGPSLQVRNGATTTSGSNFLGTDAGGMLQDGDDISLGFAARNALGLYVMSSDPLFDSDIRLTVGAFSASLSAANKQQTFADGTSVYFLGIVDSMTRFTSASLTTSHDGAGPYFLWNADDIVTALAPVPEPETWVMLLAGLGMLGLRLFRPDRVSRP